MQIMFPDYENCGLNVVSSLMAYFGAPSRHKRHPMVESMLEGGKYRSAVLMLFDGMGMDALERFCAPDGFFRSRLKCEMTAVYPSTTTCATTSIECCRAPAEHGWLGWTLYFEAIDRHVDAFLNTYNGEPAADYPVAETFLPRRFVYRDINAAGKAEAHFISHHCDDLRIDTLDELTEQVRAQCEKPGRHFLYTYWNDPDHTMHDQGVTSDSVRDIILDIERRIESLAAALPEDTLLMITADHGLIDAKHLYVEDHPELMRALKRDTSIEPRATAFYVKDEYKKAFPDLFRECFGDDFMLLEREEFISRFLGPGERNPLLGSLVGDHMALACGPECIDMRRRDHSLIGVHAGLTAAEMRVPLITARS